MVCRHLLTHTSGFAYGGMDPRLIKWCQLNGFTPSTKGVPMMTTLSIPLLFEPGTSFQYGLSIDWAGVLVMRLTDMNLEDYM